MVLFTHIVEDPEGMHARPVARIAAEARQWISTSTVSCGTARTEATDLMGLMAMDVARGDELTITVEGPDEEAAAMALQRVFTF